MKKLFTILLILAFASSCEDTDFSSVPDVSFVYYVDLDEDYPLLGFGESITIDESGYAGLIVYCSSYEQYFAYDLCCPKHTDSLEQLIVNNETAICPTDSSIYHLHMGEPALEYNSATPTVLRSYSTSLNDGYLRIYN